MVVKIATTSELVLLFRAKDEVSDRLKVIADRADDTGNRLAAIGPRLAVGATAGAAALGALTKSAFDLGASFDDAFDRIAVRTGAMGPDLERLQQNFRNVAGGGVASGFTEISTAIAEVGARLRLTGDDLEGRSRQFLDLSRITGSDLTENIRTVSRAFGDWQIATESQGQALDTFFRATQQGGGSVAQLSERITQFGVPLRQLGFSFDEAVALLTKFEREGVNVEQVMGSLRIAIADFAKAGVDAPAAFREIIEVIGTMEDETQALALAMEIFGKRAGADMAGAIREGKFAIEDLVEAIGGGEEGITDIAERTADAAEKMQARWNEVALAFEPAGKAVFELAGDLTEKLGPALVDTARLVTPLVTWFGENLPKALDTSGEAIDRFLEAIKRATRPELFQGVQAAQNAAVSPDLAALLGGRAEGRGPQLPPAEAVDQAEADQDAADAATARALEAAQQAAARAAELEQRRAAARAYIDEVLRKIREGDPQRETGGGGRDRTAVVSRELVETRTAIDGFMAELQRDAPRWERAFGQIGSRVAIALGDAIESGTEASGAGVGRALQDLIREAERSGVANFQALGDELTGSLHDALINRGNPALKAAALENLRAYTETIKQANALTPETFERALGLTQAAERLGSGGAAIMDSLERALEDGGKQNIDALARAATAMRRALLEDQQLTPERAGEWASGLMEAVNRAIRDRSSEAREALRSFLESLNFELPLEKLGQQLGDRINVAIDDIAAAIIAAGVQAQRQIEQAANSLQESRTLRAALENVRAVQADELKGATESARRALQDLQDFREDRERGRQRAREDADAIRQQAQADEDRARARIQQLEEARRQNEPRGTPVGGLGTQAERRGGVDEIRRRFRLEDEELDRRRQREDADRDHRRSQEDAILAQRRQERETDRAQDERIAEGLRQFQERQRENLQAFTDAQADEGLRRQITRIETERDEAIAKLNERLTETTRLETEHYNAAVERINTQRVLWDGVLDGYLADLEEATRRQNLLDIPKPTPGPIDTEPLPEPGKRITGPATGRPEGEGGRTVSVTVNIGTAFGFDDLIAQVERGLAQRIEGLTAVGGF